MYLSNKYILQLPIVELLLASNSTKIKSILKININSNK